MKSLQIGKIKLKNNLILSPMVDVTDLAYRLICRKAGASMAYTEMLYIDAILHENDKTKKLMKTCKEDSPIGLQVTGNSEEEFKRFAKLKELKNFDLIDINCGCPSIKITGNEAGSFLLKNPSKIARMIKILKKERFIVTAKIRLGFEKNNVLQVVKEIEKAGADALTVHARLAVHGRDVPADWKWIKRVKEIVKIPIIGNGDIFSGKDAERMMKETGCDGVMIARGAIGDPLIFSRILEYVTARDNLAFQGEACREHPKNKCQSNLTFQGEAAHCFFDFRTGEERELDMGKNLKLFKEYLELVEKYNIVDIGRIKYLGGKFLRGFDGAAKKREEFMKLKSFDDVKNFQIKF